MLINKVVHKLGFLRKFPRPIAKIFFKFLIFFDHIFFEVRVFFLSLFLGKNNKVSKALKDLKNNGVAVISNFYGDEETKKIKDECIKYLDKIPVEKLKTRDYIDNMPVTLGNTKLYFERLGGSIKFKGLNNVSNYLKNIIRKYEIDLLIKTYHLILSEPLIVYNVTHTGSFQHPVMLNPEVNDKAIAGNPHLDLYFHQLRCFIALSDVEETNGPTIYYKKSLNINEIKKNHLNLILESFDFKVDKNESHVINSKKIEYLDNMKAKSILKCKKGDLVLMDLKTVHYGTVPKNGERHLLWLYY